MPRTPFYLSSTEDKDGPMRHQCLRFMDDKFKDQKGKVFIVSDNTAFDMPLTTTFKGSRGGGQRGESPTFLQCFPYFPRNDEMNHRIAVIGKSGSGKSFTIGLVLDQMIHNKPEPHPERSKERKQDPTRGRIIIFSGVNQDLPLDRIRRNLPPVRPNIEDKDGLMKIKPQMFNDCIVVFDDIEKITNKDVNKFLRDLRGNLMECGRHTRCDVISVSHNILAGSANKEVKNELTGMFLYPDYNQKHTTDTFLQKYIGLTKDVIEDKVMVRESRTSRWVFIGCLSPIYIVWDKGIEILPN